jgi:tetratricopeptide (TPR) repeat protein
MHRTAPLLALFALVALAPLGRAGDAEAKALLDEALKHWSDPQPTEVLRLANEALGKGPEKVLKTQIQILIGSVHQAKTGDLDAALKIYDEIIQANVNATDNNLKQLKADAMVRKANILYSEKDDTEGALRLMQSAHQIWPLSTTADNASQFLFRQGRLRDKAADAKKTALEGALRLEEEAIQRAPGQFGDARLKDRLAKHVAKCKLQLALVQLALGKADESKATYDSIPAADMGDACLYQQAVLEAMQGAAPEGITDKLTRFMTNTRARGPEGAKARNQLRKFIRTEPDFEKFLTREDWKPLVTDEALPEKAPGK